MSDKFLTLEQLQDLRVSLKREIKRKEELILDKKIEAQKIVQEVYRRFMCSTIPERLKKPLKTLDLIGYGR